MKTNQQLIQEFKNFKLSKYEFFWNHNYRHIMRGLKYNKLDAYLVKELEEEE